jgi:hypothetical protein
MSDSEPEVVEVGEEDAERDAIRAENARDYPADLPAGLEAATIDEMRKVLEVVELGVRNVEVDFARPGNVGHARAFRKLQSKLSVLRSQAMSFKWSPGFVTVLRQARYMRVLPILAGSVGGAPKSRLRREGKCCQVCGTEEHACEYVFELLGSPCVQHPKRDAHGRTMLKCEPCEIATEFERLQGEDAWIAEETDRQKSAEDPVWRKRSPPGYLGMFAVGSTCLQRVRLAMWAQSFLLNLAGTADERLGRIAPAALERREANGSIHMPTATDERAQSFLQQIERAESLLRAGSGAGVGASMPVPDSYLGYQRPIWDRVVEWNKMARANTDSAHMLPQAMRGQQLLDQPRGDGAEWDTVQCFGRWKDDREGERESDSSASDEDSEDGDWSETGSTDEDEEDAPLADDSGPRRKRKRKSSNNKQQKKKKKSADKSKKRRRDAPQAQRPTASRKRRRRLFQRSREEDDGQDDVGGAAPAEEAPPAAARVRPGKRRQNVIEDDDDGGAASSPEEATDSHGFSVRDLEAATALSISERGRPAKSARTDSGAGSSTDPLPLPREEEEEEDAVAEGGCDDEERPADRVDDDDDDDDAAGSAVVMAGQARVIAQMIANAHAEAAAAIAAAVAKAVEEAQLAREVRRAQARYERQREAAEQLIAQFDLGSIGMMVRAPALLAVAA